MAVHQAVDCVGVPTFGVGEQVLSFFYIGPHGRIMSAECEVRNAEWRAVLSYSALRTLHSELACVQILDFFC